MYDHKNLVSLIKQFMPYAQKHIGFTRPPRLFLKQDHQNANNPLGKTAYYNHETECVFLYITGRHPKDILRSLGHELVHHRQNCEGMFNDAGYSGKGYAQKNPHLRKLEAEANEQGSMCLRDFTDLLEENNTIYYEYLQKGANNMSTKKWKNGELKNLLSEAWGFKMDLDKLNESKKEKDHKELINEEGEHIFAPSHYCIHHGGVNHNGKIEMAEAVQHVEPDKNGHISHYDMKLTDGTILENVAAEDIQITDASLAESHDPGKRDHKPMKKKGKPDADGDNIPDWADKKPKKAGGDEDRKKPTNEEVEDVEEGACGDMDAGDEEIGLDIDDGFGDDMDLDAIIDRILGAVEDLRGLTGDVDAIEMSDDDEFMQESNNNNLKGGNENG